MKAYDIIKKKRDGYILDTEEINYFVKNSTNNTIPDYQISALFMAIYFNKLNKRETLDLTKAMINSGETIDLSQIKGTKVDKHSTGGVGDTTTLILGPMVAACGVPFVKMSGRGLGHTGGTLDKLDSIKNFRTELTIEEFVNISNTIGISLCSQSTNIAPADKKFYSLRDVTATVDNLSLIASSIMSKKLAIKSDGIVLDVKLGNGAFMKNLDDALDLAQEMVDIGTSYGRETIALISNMNEPLGNAIGNALEVKEAVNVLQGKGPQDIYELCLILGSRLLLLAKKVETEEQGRMLLKETITSGSAYEKLLELVKYQGGNVNYIKDLNLLPKAKYILKVKSRKAGYVQSLNAEEIGNIVLNLGAGRKTIDSIIDLSTGIVLNKKTDEKVEINDTLAYVHTNELSTVEKVKEKIRNLYVIGNKNKNSKKLIYGLVTKNSVNLY